MRSPTRRGTDSVTGPPRPWRGPSQAHQILRSLGDVLCEAQSRGIELTASFLHFARRLPDDGPVGVDEFMSAVVELRLVPPAWAWGEEDTEECIFEISGQRSRAFFSREDFVRYFSKPQRTNDENDRPVNPTTATIATAAAATTTISATRRAVARQHKPPRKTTASPGGPTLSPVGKTRKENSDGHLHSLSNNTSDDDERPAPRDRTRRKRPLGSLLPNWAHVRSKRALRELEELQRRQNRPPKVPVVAGAGSQHPSSVPPLQMPEVTSQPVIEGQEDAVEAVDSTRSDDVASHTHRSISGDHESPPVLAFPDDPSWGHFDIDDETTLSYLILTQESVLATPSHMPTLASYGLKDTTNSVHTPGRPFRLTVVIDAFQRLETLRAFFSPFLVHNPRGKILILGFPTRVRARTVLNAEFLAAAYTRLLLHLMETTREWLVQPKLGLAAVPQYLIGIGTGAHVALHMLTTEIPLHLGEHPGLGLFCRAQRGLVMLNAVVDPTTDPTAHYTWSAWRKLLGPSPSSAGNSTEWHEALIRSLFSDHYLTQIAPSRQHAMTTFFESRRHFLEGPSLTLLQELVRGMVKSRADLRALENLLTITTPPFGVVVVHGTHNAMTPASQVDLLARLVPPPLAEDLSVCFEERAEGPRGHVAWLKCGHEMLQERPSFVYELFHNLVQVTTESSSPLTPETMNLDKAATLSAADARAAVMSFNALGDLTEAPSVVAVRPSSTDLGDGHTDEANDGDRAARRAMTGLPEADLEAISARVQADVAEKGLKWIQQELYDRDIEGSGATAAIVARYETALIREARQAHRERQLAELKHQQHEAAAAERLAKQREELERATREKEGRLQIQRKEHEAQRAFFERMEAEKAALALVTRERSGMEMEDLHSRKFNEQCRREEARGERNTDMALKVAEIERDREEQEHVRYQVALQQQRLETQQEKREALKRFQKAFEQDQFVCSAVDAYNLDLKPEYGHFGALAHGARTLATDLGHFYGLKSAQIEEAHAKREAVGAQRQLVADKELALRNLERVLLKAKNTGMIAKAGLGTVRIVPISPAEIQALGREVEDARDELARLLHDQQLATASLAWMDKMLQRLSVLIKRNEGFRLEMLETLRVACEHGNEMVLCIREDMEKLFERREKNEALAQRLRIRLQLVQDEQRRAEAATTEYFDSRLRIEGMTQRVLRYVVLKELTTEHEALLSRLGAMVDEETTIRLGLTSKQADLTAFGAATHEIEKAREKLDQTHPPKPIKSKQGAGSESDDNEAEEEGFETEDAEAERVRQKPHGARTPEEKRWVGLDFALHFAHYYKHVAAPEVELVQRHPDYQLPPGLTKAQLERLVTLPARNCLALAFIKTSEELEAHALLRKYSFGDGDAYYARLDRDFELPGSLEPPAAVVTTLAEIVPALERMDNPRLRSRGVLLRNPEVAATRTLLSAQQQQIPPHKSVTHTFRLPATAVGVLGITVSIAFHGHFRSIGYQNGRLAAMLYVLPPTTTTTTTLTADAVAPIPIGRCLTETDIALCTPHSMGKVVLRHEPTKKPLAIEALYQVVLGAPVRTTYSIEITAATAPFAAEVLRKKRSDALKAQELLPLQKDELREVFTTIQLSERKKRLARTMANSARDAARVAETAMLRQTKELEADNVDPQLSAEARRALHAAIQSAERTFTEQCFLYAKREEEVREVEAGLKELTRIHADLLEAVERMERDLETCREHLPTMAAALVESPSVAARDAAGTRLAKELHVEYESIGARTGKVLWAELSAMKATLPSMMTPAERLRRKYKKGQDMLEKKEREWVLLDRILHPTKYEWEERLVIAGAVKGSGETSGGSRLLRLHGTHPKLSKDEEQLAVLSAMEIERILKAPWNLLERREIQIRKILTRFRDDHSGANGGRSRRGASDKSPTTMVAMLRSQKPSELTTEEREWRQYDQLLNPIYYPRTLETIAEELRATTANGHPLPPAPKIPAHLTREDLIVALNSPEEELFKLPSELLRARTILLKYDPQLSTNLVEAARLRHGQETTYEKVEMDVDARCRLVYAELQRAIANTRNEYMDSSVLHTTLQRFPTKVLRLELEKELDRLLMSQVTERERFELENFLSAKQTPGPTRSSTVNHRANAADDSVSESDSDEEAVIAREKRAQERAKAQAKQGPRDKVRGRALKQKTLQKQRREIKDALQGRSLQEQRRLLAAQELGVGGCMACRANPCTWKPYLQESFVTVRARIELLQEELERVKRCTEPVLTSTVCLAAVKAGSQAITLRRGDLFDEVTTELKLWDKHLRLRAVDAEFHETFRSDATYFETEALHGFRQVQLTEKVQRALYREHNVLVAGLLAQEVVEDILEYMLEGWVFGERESERRVLGYVPSIKREGPLTMHDLRCLAQDERILEAKAALTEEADVQGIPLDKWKPIEVAAMAVNTKAKAVRKGSVMDHELWETENALKFGIFCMTLMYFRGLSLLQKQRTVWSTSALKQRLNAQPTKTPERRRMELEARNVAARARKAAVYDEKAAIGQARAQKIQEQRTAAYRRRMVLENQRAKRELHAAIEIQRHYRGHMGRRAGRKWMLRRREIDAQRALERAAAITLQRAYRGRLGRIEADERRIELAEFISQIRAEEAIEEEEEYWRRHRLERFARRVTSFVRKQA